MANTTKGKLEELLNTLPTDPADASDINDSLVNINTLMAKQSLVALETTTAKDSTVAKASVLSTVKTKTDLIPEAPADQTLLDAKLGLVNDTASNQTLLGYQNSLYQHVHQRSRCYPSLADGVLITGGTSAWTLGNFIQIIPSNTITTAFDIHYVVVEAASAADIYELVLYSGGTGSETEIGRIRIDKESANQSAANCVIQVPVQSANSRITAKLASKSGGNDTITISLHYHIYN